MIAAANKCDFHKGFCDNCQQVSRDEQILNRIVFGINNQKARQKLFKEGNLQLANAVKIIEAAEAVRETEMNFLDKNVQAIQRKAKKDKVAGTLASKGGDHKAVCFYCGHQWKPQHLKGKTCHDCGRKGHFAGTKMCKDKSEIKGENVEKKHSHAVLNDIATTTETVEVQIQDQGHVFCHQAMIDTGSDWDCISASNLSSLGRTVESLSPPDWKMQNTRVADGKKLTSLDHYPVTVKFGSKILNTKLVVFKELDKMILSKLTLQSLGIVVINKIPDTEPSTICPILKQNHILLPYKGGKIVMSIDTGVDSSSGVVTRESVIREFDDVFKPRAEPKPGEKFKIELESDAKPCKVRYARHVPMAYKVKLKAELDELVENGIISPVSKPTDWCSPIVVTNKKNSDNIRLCVDFRQLNRSVARELYPTKSVLEVWHSIERNEAKVFSEFDAVKGYHEIPLDEESKDLTTFITPFGRYRYERAPFGICSISKHFERRMDESLENLPNIIKVVDNNCIYSKDIDSHVCHVRAFLQRSREKKIHLSKKKFIFAQKDQQNKL